MKIYIQFLNQEIRDHLYYELKHSSLSLDLKSQLVLDCSDVVQNGYFLIIGIDLSKVWFLVEYMEDRVQITFDQVIGDRHYHEIFFKLSDIYDINFSHS